MPNTQAWVSSVRNFDCSGYWHWMRSAPKLMQFHLRGVSYSLFIATLSNLWILFNPSHVCRCTKLFISRSFICAEVNTHYFLSVVVSVGLTWICFTFQRLTFLTSFWVEMKMDTSSGWRTLRVCTFWFLAWSLNHHGGVSGWERHVDCFV
jgi:hypothetical protein